MTQVTNCLYCMKQQTKHVLRVITQVASRKFVQAYAVLKSHLRYSLITNRNEWVKQYKEITTRLGTCGCFATGEVSFENQGRSWWCYTNKVFCTCGGKGTGRYEMMGPNAEHLAHLLAWSTQKKMTVSEMLDMPFYPQLSKKVYEQRCADLNAKLHLGQRWVKHCLDCGPGC